MIASNMGALARRRTVWEWFREGLLLVLGVVLGQVGSRMTDARRNSMQNTLVVTAHTESIRAMNISLDALRADVNALRTADADLSKAVAAASRDAEARADRMEQECRRRDERIESRVEQLDDDIRALSAAQGVIVGQGLTPRYRRIPRRRTPGADAGDDDGEGGCPVGHYMPPLDDPNFLARLAAEAAEQPPPDS